VVCIRFKPGLHPFLVGRADLVRSRNPSHTVFRQSVPLSLLELNSSY
jgi:hypothetical protein